MNRHRGEATSIMTYFVRLRRILAACAMLGCLAVAALPADAGDQLATPRMSTALAAHTLWLDSARAYPGDNVFYNVNLSNSVPVGSFNLLVKYDASSIWPISLTADGTRATDFEYFEYTYDEFGTPGNVRIVGVAGLNGATPLPASSLPPGNGSLARFTFVVANDIDLAGLYIPIRFIFLDSPANDDNTLTDETGVKVEQSQIDYYDGYIAVREMGAVNLGDINLNGFAYEVSDYVYFSNYFMNPTGYLMNALQLANSDMNHDFIMGSIADLITLINKIMEGAKVSRPAGPRDLIASVEADRKPDATVISYSTDFEVGGVYLALRTSEPVSRESVKSLNESMELRLVTTDSEVRLFIYSRDGATMPAGSNDLISISGLSDFAISSVDLAGADGRTASVSFAASGASIPSGFVLHQNYPNPFNPETHIAFDLSAASDVRLTVYDLLGREITTLLDDRFEAGRHDAVWTGRDRQGQTVASGVYFYRLSTEYGSFGRKMILMK
jgi:hypothetical protein